MIDNLEDFFVNGMTYNPNIKLFSAFVNKNDHIHTIKSYYGRISISAVSSWEKINSLVDGMFSQQYDGIGRRKVHFYGNDGVCLFKYFVSRDDPQKMYVWANLLFNLLCFTIMFSYQAIKVVIMKGRYWVILFYMSYLRELFS